MAIVGLLVAVEPPWPPFRPNAGKHGLGHVL